MFDFGLYTQVSDSGPHGPLVFHFFFIRIHTKCMFKCIFFFTFFLSIHIKFIGFRDQTAYFLFSSPSVPTSYIFTCHFDIFDMSEPKSRFITFFLIGEIDLFEFKDGRSIMLWFGNFSVRNQSTLFAQKEITSQTD